MTARHKISKGTLASSVFVVLFLVSFLAVSSDHAEDFTPVVVLGRVTNLSGEPVQNATVTLLCLTCGGQYITSTLTDVTGAYNLTIPPAYLIGYNIAVWVENEGYYKVERAIKPKPDQLSLTVDVILEREISRTEQLGISWNEFEDGIIPILVTSILAFGAITVFLNGYGGSVKASLKNRRSLIIGIVAGTVSAITYLVLSTGATTSLSTIQTLTIFLVTITSVMVGLSMTVFAYGFGTCGMKKSKEHSVGFLGALSSVPAALAACPVCVQPIMVALLGIATTTLLSQYRVLFVTLPILLMVVSVVLSARKINRKNCRTDLV